MSSCKNCFIIALTTVIALCWQECESFSQLPLHSSYLSRTADAPRRSGLVAPLFAQVPTSVRSSSGSDALGFSSSLSQKGFQLSSQVIFGSNAIEHGINLLEERTKNILLISGWNAARLDPILWELEPRGFLLSVCSVSVEPTCETLHEIIAAAMQSNCGAIIAMGCGGVIDSAKLATTLLNTIEDRKYLSNMSPAELETYVLSNTAGDHSKSVEDQGHGKGKVLLVTVPALPSLGAELSDIVALRKIIDRDTDKSESFKVYVKAAHPDLALIQPSLTYRAPMELVHDRLIALIATTVDIILADPGFMPEMLAWDSLRQLILLLDKAIESAEDRFTQWLNDPKGYEEQTVHDDESDHRSQHFRRYGHGFDLSIIEDLCRIGISVASAKSGVPIGGLQYLSDSLGEVAGCRKGHTTRVVQLFPSYITALQEWCESDDSTSSRVDSKEDSKGDKGDGVVSGRRSQGAGREGREGREDPYKAFVRTKLDRVCLIAQTSKYLSYTPSDNNTPSTTQEGQQLGKEINVINGVIEINDKNEVKEVKEIVGETCGQIMPLATSTPQTLDTKTSGILINQTEKLRDYFRLLSGPLGVEEEKDPSENGDALTVLRNRLRDRSDEEKNEIVKASFDPNEFEKEEKANFTICGYIEEDELLSGGGFDMGPIRSRRALPSVSVSERDCYRIKMDMKRVCGESPACHLSVGALRELLSSGYDGDEKIEKAGNKGDIIESGNASSNSDKNNVADSDINSNSVSKSADGDSQDSTTVTVSDSNFVVEHSPSNAEKHSVESVLTVPSDSSENTHTTADTVESSHSSIGASSDASSSVSHFVAAVGEVNMIEKEEVTTPTAIEIVPDIVHSPIGSILSIAADSSRGSETQIESHGVSTSAGASVSVSAGVSVSEVTEQNAVEHPTDHPAAAQRRKMKKILADLSRTIGTPEVQEVTVVESRTREEIEEEEAVERKTDLLARMLEQRIHDRWAQAKLDAIAESPFNKIRGGK